MLDALEMARRARGARRLVAHSDAGSQFAGCAKAAHLHFVIQYQPVARYWALQGVDSALLAAGGLVALLASVRLLTLPRVEW